MIARFGRIDVLVNNAGMGSAGATEESSLDQDRRVFDVNVFGVLRMTKAVLPHMRAQGSGRIINISSIFGFMPAPFMAPTARPSTRSRGTPSRSITRSASTASGCSSSNRRHPNEIRRQHRAARNNPLPAYAASRRRSRRSWPTAVNAVTIPHRRRGDRRRGHRFQAQTALPRQPEGASAGHAAAAGSGPAPSTSRSASSTNCPSKPSAQPPNQKAASR